MSRSVALVFLLGAALSLPSSAGEIKRTWTSCQLRAVNRTPYRVLIHVDGVYWGWVSPHQTFVFRGIPSGKILAYGATQLGESFWGPQAFQCAGTITWNLAF